MLRVSVGRCKQNAQVLRCAQDDKLNSRCKYAKELNGGLLAAVVPACEADALHNRVEAHLSARTACDTEIYDAAEFCAPGGERSQVGGGSFNDRDGDGN